MPFTFVFYLIIILPSISILSLAIYFTVYLYFLRYYIYFCFFPFSPSLLLYHLFIFYFLLSLFLQASGVDAPYDEDISTPHEKALGKGEIEKKCV